MVGHDGTRHDRGADRRIGTVGSIAHHHIGVGALDIPPRIDFRSRNAEPDAHIPHPFEVRAGEACVKIGVVAFLLRRPADFGQGGETREQLILREMGRVVEQFRPQAALEAFHQFFLPRFEVEALHRIEGIHFLDVDERGPGMAAFGEGMLHIEIQEVAVLRHDRETGVDGLLEHVLAMPDQHQVVARQVFAGDDVFPAFQRLAVLGQNLLHPLREVAQQLPFIGVTEFLHQFLAVGAVFPRLRGHFFHAHVEVFRREDGGEFLDDVLEYRIVLLTAHAEHIVDFTLHALHIRIVLADHFGIGHGQGFGMARQVHLGNDLDAPVGGISHDFLQVFLGIESAVAFFSGIERGLQRFPIAAPRADGSQERILLDFHAPAVVVGQVPVELVDLVVGQPVEMAQDVFLVEEGARHVEHTAAPGKAGLVDDFDARNLAAPEQLGVRAGSSLVDLWRKHLQQGLDGIELALAGRGADEDAGRGDLERIAFLGETLDADEIDRPAFSDPAVAPGIEEAGEMLLQILHVEGVAAIDADVLIENERFTLPGLDRCGHRHEIERRLRRRIGEREAEQGRKHKRQTANSGLHRE